ncbi:MAG: FAD-dependent oxidoreductase, partial [Actinobacteria bacterium]|nr:FAD-dependent oxidoreductase [Actinomycetota bacterium]
MVVIGGGAIGLASAWKASRAGMSVALVDPAPGRGASWMAAGMLAPVTEAHYGEEALLALGLAAAGQWPPFAAEPEEATGMDVGALRGVRRQRGGPGGEHDLRADGG